MENNYNINSSTSFFRFLFTEYRWLIIFFIIIPILLGISCCLSVPFLNEAGSPAWLSFWGGYLGSIIMAGITLYVLDKQLKQNHKENEDNRIANDKANELNRKLQLNILLYQQEQIWLNQFRNASIDYVSLYSYNDLVDVANIARKDPYEAFYLVKNLFTRAGNVDLKLSFWERINVDYKKLYEDKTKLFEFYNNVLNDIQILLIFRKENPHMYLKNILSNPEDLSEDMISIINKVITECPNFSIKDQFNSALMTRIKIIEKTEEKLREWFCKFIHLEQLRIDNILSNNGTEQDK